MIARVVVDILPACSHHCIDRMFRLFLLTASAENQVIAEIRYRGIEPGNYQLTAGSSAGLLR